MSGPVGRRRIVYVTGTRADYGLMRETLRRIDAHPALDLSLFVTGMHLLPAYGETVQEIVADGLSVAARWPVELSGSDGGEMALAVSETLRGFVETFRDAPPDMVLLLGDRGEMLAGAIGALHLGCATVHVHGGERSGTVDEPVRHAISKLAHFHLTATVQAATRLRQMGEDDWRIRTVGAPGLDDLANRDAVDRPVLAEGVGFDPTRPIAVAVFHPVVQDGADAARQMQTMLDSLLAAEVQVLALAPNADAGGSGIADVMQRIGAAHPDQVRLIDHLPRGRYLAWLAAADLLIGNSSSGIIESASLGIPCVNLGDRQMARDRNTNVIDVPDIGAQAVSSAIATALQQGRQHWPNIWGDGRTAPRVATFLAAVDLNPAVFRKLNSY
ncbi:MAG: UDP-N,N'-diacetylbacillosamine 2-epimerase (hydrolyzing) [Minwuia thermotolerans]|nr:MAG: UDP-N,N'-diacetylbacillosamine 2-epimerase (hydrolyzing) [Minwuia thermotolerans]